MARKQRKENPRFLESRGTIKGIPALEKRRKAKKLQKLARRIQRESRG